MILRYTLILVFSFVIYYFIIYLIQIGLVFRSDSHARGFYVVIFPYSFVLLLMSIFYRYKIMTLLVAVPTSLIVWKINDFLCGNGFGSTQIDILLMITLILLMIINELLFFMSKRKQ